jgi:hypothetical protein
MLRIGIEAVVRRFIAQPVNRGNKTGKTINAKYWSVKTSRPIQTIAENKILTTELNALENHILKEYNTDYSKGVIFSKDWLSEKIDTFFNRIEVKTDDAVFLNSFTESGVVEAAFYSHCHRNFKQ